MSQMSTPQIEFDEDAPLLVFGGPYSNLAATRALIEQARRLAIPARHVICTGDVVAYCAEPEETARAIHDWGCHVVRGNCEESLASGANDCGCNFEDGTACDLLARGWYPFALSRVSDELRTWMGGLPRGLSFTCGGISFCVVHGGVEETARWVFASLGDVIAEEMESARSEVVIAGHCGLPFIARHGAGAWFNPGVIGMPANDATPDGWYGLIEPRARGGVKLSIHRLRYDYHASAATMRRSGHANGYARSLVTGLWPSLDVLPDEERRRTGERLKPLSVALGAKTGGRKTPTQLSQPRDVSRRARSSP